MFIAQIRIPVEDAKTGLEAAQTAVDILRSQGVEVDVFEAFEPDNPGKPDELHEGTYWMSGFMGEEVTKIKEGTYKKEGD
jgi:hypothetical protein